MEDWAEIRRLHLAAFLMLLMAIAGFIHALVTPKTVPFAPVEENKKKQLFNA